MKKLEDLTHEELLKETYRQAWRISLLIEEVQYIGMDLLKLEEKQKGETCEK